MAQDKPVNWMKLPLGKQADYLGQVREKRLQLDAQVKEMKAQEESIRTIIIGKLQEQGMQKTSGRLYTVGLNPKTEPLVEDWQALDEYIVANRALDLLHRRTSAPAFRVRWEQGVTIPGVRAVEVIDLSLTKSTRGSK
jgi:hypothetical protein